mmetsp:Transcript_14740/g.43684  ORF Transcript_14740/g.43684 Transcript_14740/m.43684 type:complete len:220 (-) Transcript_14740:1100-1759(-)
MREAASASLILRWYSASVMAAIAWALASASWIILSLAILTAVSFLAFSISLSVVACVRRDSLSVATSVRRTSAAASASLSCTLASASARFSRESFSAWALAIWYSPSTLVLLAESWAMVIFSSSSRMVSFMRRKRSICTFSTVTPRREVAEMVTSSSWQASDRVFCSILYCSSAKAAASLSDMSGLRRCSTSWAVGKRSPRLYILQRRIMASPARSLMS